MAHYYLSSSPFFLFRVLINDDILNGPDLAKIVAFFAILWFIVLTKVDAIIQPLLRNSKWILDAFKRNYEHSITKKQKKKLKKMDVFMTKEEYLQLTIYGFPRMQTVCLQHFVGTCFCIPAIFNIGGFESATASSIAMLGILSEIGWELMDVLRMIYVRIFRENGKKIVPDRVFHIELAHHSLASCLGVQFILNFHDSRMLHWMVFDLHFSSAIMMTTSTITKFLDITDPRQMRLFKVLNFICFVVVVWTRIIHWVYLASSFAIALFESGSWAFGLFGSYIGLYVFTRYSFHICVLPLYNKCKMLPPRKKKRKATKDESVSISSTHFASCS
jgi:hypothetical protein